VPIEGSYDHYELLGVTPTATTEEINAAYRTLAKRLHPDVLGDASTALFAMVADARAVLTDPERRARYDRIRNRPVVLRRTEPTRPPTRPPTPEPAADYVAEDVPPRPPPPSEDFSDDTGWRPSSYPPPVYQTYFARSGSYPPPAYQTYFGRTANSRPPQQHPPFRHHPYTQSSRPAPRASSTLPPLPSRGSPGRLLLLIARGFATATTRYAHRKRR
jgi:curved DNA-binding protein CbpA